MQLPYTLIPIFITTVIWEHIGKRYIWTVRPSVALIKVVAQSQKFWEWIGVWFGIISSYLTYIELGDLWRSVYDIVNPMIELIASPAWFFKGYLSIMIEFTYPYLIPLGSCLLVLTSMYICYHFNLFQRFSSTRLVQSTKARFVLLCNSHFPTTLIPTLTPPNVKSQVSRALRTPVFKE